MPKLLPLLSSESLSATDSPNELNDDKNYNTPIKCKVADTDTRDGDLNIDNALPSVQWTIGGEMVPLYTAKGESVWEPFDSPENERSYFFYLDRALVVQIAKAAGASSDEAKSLAKLSGTIKSFADDIKAHRGRRTRFHCCGSSPEALNPRFNDAMIIDVEVDGFVFETSPYLTSGLIARSKLFSIGVHILNTTELSYNQFVFIKFGGPCLQNKSQFYVVTLALRFRSLLHRRS